jgi:hypothetical protein
MKMLSDDDLNLKGMTREELARSWDLWFDLAQSTNDSDPPYSHGVFVGARRGDVLRRADTEDVGAAPTTPPGEERRPSSNHVA